MSQHPFWRRAPLAAAVVVIALLAVPASSLGGASAPRGGPWVITSAAEKGAALKTAGGREVSLWIWRTSAGERCVGLHITAQPVGTAPQTPNGGGSCEVGAARPQRQPIEASLSWVRLDGTLTTLVDGRVALGRGISRLELALANGSHPVALRGPHFLLELPSGAASAIGALDGGSYALVGYDTRGNEIARLDLNELVRSASPES